MTDYASSSEPPRDRRSSKSRTLNWVHTVPRQQEFCPPSFPPTPRDDADDISAFSDSDAESSHSTPPRMVLRYPDGRDIRISTDYPPKKRVSGSESMNRASSRQHDERGASHTRSRSVSAAPRRVSTDHGDRVSRSNSHARTSPRDGYMPPNLVSSRGPAHPSRPQTVQPPSIRPQEDIRVLPTYQNGTSHAATYGSSRNPTVRSHPSQTPVPSYLVSPTPSRAYTPSHHTLLGVSQIAVTHSQPPSHVRTLSAPPPMSYSQSHPPSKNGHLPVRATESRHQSGYMPSKLSNTYTSAGHGSNSRAHIPLAHPDSSSPNCNRARSGSATRSRNPATGSPDSWTMIDEEEARGNGRRDPNAARSQHRGQHTHRGHHRDDSSEDETTPVLDYSRSRTPSSGSQSTYYVTASPGHKVKSLVSPSLACISPHFTDVLRSRPQKNLFTILLYTTKALPRHTSPKFRRNGPTRPTELRQQRNRSLAVSSEVPANKKKSRAIANARAVSDSDGTLPVLPLRGVRGPSCPCTFRSNL